MSRSTCDCYLPLPGEALADVLELAPLDVSRRGTLEGLDTGHLVE
jgi:hypothetical protein